LKYLTQTLIFFITLSIICGCGQSQKRSGTTNPIQSFHNPSDLIINVNPEIEKYKIKKLAVLPFGIKMFANLDTTERGINHKITDMFFNQLSVNSNFDLVSKEGINSIINSYKIDSFTKENFSNAISLLKNREIDGVIMGEISRYSERRGTAISVSKPASVAFDIYLFSIESGTILWSASFNKTQRPLSENVLEMGSFLKGGGTWQTSEQMTRLAIEEIIRRFPKRRY